MFGTEQFWPTSIRLKKRYRSSSASCCWLLRGRLLLDVKEASFAADGCVEQKRRATNIVFQPGNMAPQDPRIRQIKIKTGVVKRYAVHFTFFAV